MCKAKRAFADTLRKLIDLLSKGDADPDTVIAVDLATEINKSFVPSDCAPHTVRYWSELNRMLEKALELVERGAVGLSVPYLRLVSEVVPKLIRFENAWRGRAIAALAVPAAVSGFLAPLSLATYSTLIPLLMSFTDVGLSIALEFAIGILLLFKYPILGTICVLASAAPFASRGPDVEIVEPKLPEPISEERVKELFVKVYGKEGEELFRFELYHLLANGYSKEEALAELWRRLTGTDIDSHNRADTGEHVRAGSGEGQGTENNREEGNHD